MTLKSMLTGVEFDDETSYKAAVLQNFAVIKELLFPKVFALIEEKLGGWDVKLKADPLYRYLIGGIGEVDPKIIDLLNWYIFCEAEVYDNRTNVCNQLDYSLADGELASSGPTIDKDLFDRGYLYIKGQKEHFTIRPWWSSEDEFMLVRMFQKPTNQFRVMKLLGVCDCMWVFFPEHDCEIYAEIDSIANSFTLRVLRRCDYPSHSIKFRSPPWFFEKLRLIDRALKDSGFTTLFYGAGELIFKILKTNDIYLRACSDVSKYGLASDESVKKFITERVQN